MWRWGSLNSPISVLHRSCHVHFIPVICCSPAVQAGAFLWACEVSNSYFYHKLETLLSGHIPLWKRQSLAIRDLCGVSETKALQVKAWISSPRPSPVSCSLHLWSVQTLHQRDANIHIFSQRASAAVRTRCKVCLRWVYGCCSGESITSATNSCQKQEWTMLPADIPLPPATAHQWTSELDALSPCLVSATEDFFFVANVTSSWEPTLLSLQKNDCSA